MSEPIRDQLLNQGVVKPEETPEAKRALKQAALPPEPEKESPPPFEAPARGVIVNSSSKSRGRL